MKVAFVDLNSLMNHCKKNCRTLDIYNCIKEIASKESGDEELVVNVVADTHRDSAQPTVQKMLSVRQEFQKHQNTQIVIVNGYNEDEDRHLGDIVIQNMIYQDFIATISAGEEPHQYIIATAGTRFLTTMGFLQEQTGIAMKFFMPDDLPYLGVLQEVFIVDTLDLGPEGKTILDRLIIHHILRVIYWCRDEKNFPATASTVIESAVKYGNVARFDVSFMLNALLGCKILVAKRDETPDGHPCTVIDIQDEEAAEKLLTEIDVSSLEGNGKKVVASA